MKPYIIVDIDGTIALHVNQDGSLRRGHHEYERVADDLPNEPIIDLITTMHGAGVEVAFVSGRPGAASVRGATRRWLREHVKGAGIYEPLYMRAERDYRPDDVVKEEIFRDQVLPAYDGRWPLLVLDDRPRVIRMWDRLGITVLDVNPTSGEF